MIAVELLRTDLAEVVVTPSLLRRIVFREREVVRFAVRVLVVTGGFSWRWDGDGSHVEPRIVAAIEAELAQHRRVARAASGVAPPA